MKTTLKAAAIVAALTPLSAFAAPAQAAPLGQDFQLAAASIATPKLGHKIVLPGTRKGFNPQPEPPRWKGFVRPGTRKGFNPQPEPPGGRRFIRRPRRAG